MHVQYKMFNERNYEQNQIGQINAITAVLGKLLLKCNSFKHNTLVITLNTIIQIDFTLSIHVTLLNYFKSNYVGHRCILVVLNEKIIGVSMIYVFVSLFISVPKSR